MSDVVMYGAQWCGDCRRAKSYLERNGVPFIYVDLEEEPQHMETVMRFNEGRRRIPVVVFADGSHLTEPTDQELAERLTSMGIS